MKQTARKRGEKENVDYIADISDLLKGMRSVRDVAIQEQRRPILLDLYLSVPRITGEVRDVIEEFDLVIDDVEAPHAGEHDWELHLTLYAAHEFEYFETLKIRTLGNSYGITIPRDVLDEVGATEGTRVKLFARPGSLRVETGR